MPEQDYDLAQVLARLQALRRGDIGTTKNGSLERVGGLLYPGYSWFGGADLSKIPMVQPPLQKMESNLLPPMDYLQTPQSRAKTLLYPGVGYRPQWFKQ